MKSDETTFLSDRVLDASVVAFAAWTIAYQVTFLARLPGLLAPALTVLLLAAAIVWWRRSGEEAPSTVASRQPTVVSMVVVFALAAAAIAAALLRMNAAFWVLALVTVVAGLRQAGRGRPAPPPADERGGARLVALFALLAGLASLLVRAPNADDAFYVNRMLAVGASTGPFPVRDTMYGDQVFPEGIGIDTLASFEPLVGVLHWVVPVDPRTMLYLVLAPLFASAAVLAVWRLLRTVGTPRPALATGVATAVLFVDAVFMHHGGAPITRTFQGKIVFWLVVVPLLWHLMIRFVEEGGARVFLLLGAAVVSSLGLTASALLVVPVVLAGATLAGSFAAATRHRAIMVGSLVAYPALLAFAGASLQGGTQGLLAERARDTVLQAWDLSPERARYVLGAAVLLLAGWAVVRRPFARYALGASALAVVVLTHPIALGVMEEVGVGVIVPRLKWAVPVVALAGAVAAVPLGARGDPKRLGAFVGIVLLVVGSYAVGRTPLADWPRDAVGGPTWDVPPHEHAAARELADLAPPGSVVVAPQEVSVVLSMTTLDVHALSVRKAYTELIARRAGPGFGGAERLDLTRSMSVGLRGPRTAEVTAAALERFDVSAACVRAERLDRGQERWQRLGTALEQAGFEHHHTDRVCSYWVRTPSSR